MASKYTTIEVTQADIDRAMRNESARCVIATAIARSFDGAHHVSVDVQTIRFTVGRERQIYLTPPAASGYIVAFDAGDPIHPFGFRLSERHKVTARQDTMTDAGKERSRARDRARRAERKAADTQQLALVETDPLRAVVVKAEAALAAREAEEAKQESDATADRLAGQPHWAPDPTPDPETGGPKRKPPRQAFRQGVRAYGQRQMRINQGPDTVESRAARAAVTAAYDVE